MAISTGILVCLEPRALSYSIRTDTDSSNCGFSCWFPQLVFSFRRWYSVWMRSVRLDLCILAGPCAKDTHLSHREWLSPLFPAASNCTWPFSWWFLLIFSSWKLLLNLIENEMLCISTLFLVVVDFFYFIFLAQKFVAKTFFF